MRISDYNIRVFLSNLNIAPDSVLFVKVCKQIRSVLRSRKILACFGPVGVVKKGYFNVILFNISYSLIFFEISIFKKENSNYQEISSFFLN